MDSQSARAGRRANGAESKPDDVEYGAGPGALVAGGAAASLTDRPCRALE